MNREEICDGETLQCLHDNLEKLATSVYVTLHLPSTKKLLFLADFLGVFCVRLSAFSEPLMMQLLFSWTHLRVLESAHSGHTLPIDCIMWFNLSFTLRRWAACFRKSCDRNSILRLLRDRCMFMKCFQFGGNRQVDYTHEESGTRAKIRTQGSKFKLWSYSCLMHI